METQIQSRQGASTNGQPRTLAAVLGETAATIRSPWLRRLTTSGRLGELSRLQAVGGRYAQVTLDGFECQVREQEAALRAVRLFVAQAGDELPANGGSLLLFGRPGTGKDHLLIAAAYEVIHRYGFTATWCCCAELQEELRDGMDQHVRERDVVNRLARPHVLILSDPLPPKGAATPWATEVLQRIVDRRYRQGLSTWASVNVTSRQEFEERSATPLVDRLSHNATAIWCEWASYRRPR